MNVPMWEAGEQRKTNSNLHHFMEALGPMIGRKITSYDELHDFSITKPGAFWSALWDILGVVGDKGKGPWLVEGQKLMDARFFPNARLNYAENALKSKSTGQALVFWGEDKVRRSMSWPELRHAVGKLQSWQSDIGLKMSDRMAAILPNLPESIVGVLGAAAQGVTWSSCSPDFGEQGIVDRLGQIEPKALIVCDGYYYAGKTIDLSGKLRDVVNRLPSVEALLVVSYTGKADEVANLLKSEFKDRKISIETWDSAISARPDRDPDYVRVPFAHPQCILFSSGTTGIPKCIVHSTGGLLLKHVSEIVLHTDVKPGDRLFFFTTLGWMMWNWLVSGLIADATLMLYDGSPLFGDGNILWNFADAEQFTHFGTSAKYIDTLHKNGNEPRRTHSLASVGTILSTGSPLAPESFDYVYSSIKSDVHLASISGGTDICGCFILGNPLKPVWRGELQSAAIGLATDVADDEGRPLRRGKGELVCRNAFPSMPVGFWQDPDGKRYESAYFTRFPGIWHHGDFAEWTDHGGIIIHGRSDATLNPGGVRIGTAEIYRQVEQLSEIQESVSIGQPWDNDVRVVLFVVLKPGCVLDKALTDRIKTQIRTGASPRHVPARIVAVRDIPRTRSGKIAELAVRDIIMKRDVKNQEALANPEALALFRDLPELAV